MTFEKGSFQRPQFEFFGTPLKALLEWKPFWNVCKVSIPKGRSNDLNSWSNRPIGTSRCHLSGIEKKYDLRTGTGQVFYSQHVVYRYMVVGGIVVLKNTGVWSEVWWAKRLKHNT